MRIIKLSSQIHKLKNSLKYLLSPIYGGQNKVRGIYVIFSQSFPTFSQGLACGSLSLHIRTKCPVRHALNRHGIFPKLVSLISQSDKATQQELDHAKAQCLDAQRAEKLQKVDFHQMEKRVS